MCVGDTVVSGGSLTLYRVGEIVEDDGNYTFKTVDAFADFTGSLEEVQSPALAEELAGYAVDKRSLNIGLIDANGQVTFDALEPGLYLLVQNETVEGYLPAAPFLVFLPLLEDRAYVYNVDASPKVEIKTAATAEPTPKPTTPDTKLPQTGQLNWPIPFLYNQCQAERADEALEVLMPQVVSAILDQSEPAQPSESEDTAESYIPESVEDEMPEVVIEGNAYIGYISIPTLSLELPVMTDWSCEQLQSAPCRYSGTVKGNDLVIMEHNYWVHFGQLSKLAVGDTVPFTDINGITTYYAVAAKDILSAYAVEEMTAGEYDLTLFTCNYSGQSQVTVRCDKIDD